MLDRYCRLAIVEACIILSLAGCASPARLPESMLGVWVEDMVKESWPATNPKFVKSNSFNTLKFEQPDRKAVVFVSNFYDPIKQEHTWSEPYSVKETGKKSWSFQYREREVSMKLDENHQLQVKGLSVRVYNPELVKREPEPVEAIFIKKD